MSVDDLLRKSEAMMVQSDVMCEVVRLGEGDESLWDGFVSGFPGAQISHTTKWRDFLVAITGGSPLYLMAKDRTGEVRGVLPGLVQQGSFGGVLNSLPFFGTNGAVVASADDKSVHQALWDAWNVEADREMCVASTQITSPFLDNRVLYESGYACDFVDERVGQITDLRGDGDPERYLFEAIAGVRRTDIRKAVKAGVGVVERWDDEAFGFLQRTHRLNMESIGGTSKPDSFFQCIRERFGEEEDCRLYLGEVDGRYVCAVLMFYYGGIAEYFLPVVVPEYRRQAPQCLVIFRAMVDAARRGCTSWNWGGTWTSQTGVYGFKKRWAARDVVYRYYTTLHKGGSRLLKRTPEELVSEYPWNFVLPFGVLGEKPEAREKLR